MPRGATAQFDPETIVLTDGQVRLPANHRFKPEQVFDASGMQRSQFLVQAKMQSKVAFAPHAPCEAGHVFWLGSGHCIQCCSPVGLTKRRKYFEDGWIYIASSNHLRLHKIGATIDVAQRMRQLRQGYGGANDWKPTYRRKFRNHGDVEDGAMASLRGFMVPRAYLYRGEEKETRELIDCPHEKVQAAIEAFATDAIGEFDEMGKKLLRFP